jgi:hypothetical protein
MRAMRSDFQQSSGIKQKITSRITKSKDEANIV